MVIGVCLATPITMDCGFSDRPVRMEPVTDRIVARDTTSRTGSGQTATPADPGHLGVSPSPAEPPRASRRTLSWLGALIVLTVLSRWAGLWQPLGPDEAGFGLVGAAWEPGSGDLYGPYFVDRSPFLVLVFKIGNALGGPYLLRVLGALGMGVTVWCAAAVARELRAVTAPGTRPDTAMLITAVGAAALIGNAGLDPVGAKGEVLALPLLAGSVLVALRALRTRHRVSAAAAGVAGMLAVGLKQSLGASLAFGGLLLLGSLVAGRLPRRTGWHLLGWFCAGAAGVVVATVVLTLAWGGSLSSLAYAVIGFRSDAGTVLDAYTPASEVARAQMLVHVFLISGMVAVAALFLLRLPVLTRRAPVLTVAVAGGLMIDTVGIVAGGSFWTPYLYPLALSLSWALALVVAVPVGGSTIWSMGWRAIPAVLSVVLLILSVRAQHTWVTESIGRNNDAVITGAAIGAVSRPGDTMTVYGGHPDIQWASGLPSPYRELWTLPMRVNDPDLSRLSALLKSDRAPTWLAEWATPGAWQDLGEPLLAPAVAANYRQVAVSCWGRRIFLRNGVDREPPRPDCSGTWNQPLWTPTQQ